MYSYGPPHIAVRRQDDQHEHTFSSYVKIRDVVLKTCLGRWTIGRSGERGSGISVLTARHDDDDINIVYHAYWEKQHTYTYTSLSHSLSLSLYIYIYVCVCVCVCINSIKATNIPRIVAYFWLLGLMHFHTAYRRTFTGSIFFFIFLLILNILLNTLPGLKTKTKK